MEYIIRILYLKVGTAREIIYAFTYINQRKHEHIFSYSEELFL